MSDKPTRNPLLASSDFLFSLMMLAVIAMVVSIGAIGIVSVAKNGGSSSESAGTPSASGSSTVEVTLTEFAIALSPSVVPPGNVVFNVHNAGAAQHNLAAVDLNKRTAFLESGAHVLLDLGKVSSDVNVLCEIPGHADSGMKATLKVSTDSSAPVDTVAAMSNAKMDSMMEAVAKRFPEKTAGLGGQELKPTITADGYKQFDLTAKIVDWEVEGGKVVKGWAYNGQIPGPQLRANVGDKIRIRLKNELPESTSLHLHGVRVPNAMDGVDPITQPAIKPGETFDYEFTATEPAVGMYHSHHNAQVQIPNGLAGSILIGDWKTSTMKAAGSRLTDSNGKVDQEVVMVLNDAGTIGLSLNGKSFPATAPYVMKIGETMLVHYYNEGLMTHPMHMHQPTGLIVARDGKILEHPFFADTISVAPGERWSVLYTAKDAGVWAWHCHILTHAETPTGMKYMVTAVIVS
ncbi:MAG: multicopper oxidase domain-containing protein [Actinomycetes bacterium]